MAKLISKTYGDALFQAAVEKQMLNQMAEEAVLILKILKENEDLTKLLGHPRIDKEEKIRVVETIFKGRISDSMTGFLVLVIEKDRQEKLKETLDYFLELVKLEHKIGTAFVTSAAPLSEAQKQQVVKRLEETTGYRSFEMNYRTDPDLIGGMVIRIGDRVVDSSIRTRLDKMAKELSRIQLSAGGQNK
ncbi:ATP synthase F1 subunit delta [Anaerolentibacter hominis]|uniref:ATP synthase F1 subunit delta n=1 Tax=Anaerolentibacter hominis TaxID=3079009 RepID=UPI0031B82319